jgi:hypothetical protein
LNQAIEGLYEIIAYVNPADRYAPVQVIDSFNNSEGRQAKEGLIITGMMSPEYPKALQEITIEDNGKILAVRSECKGACGKIFQAVGIAIPPTIREIS